MIPGFKTRLLQELKHMVVTRKEFEEIAGVQEFIQMNETCVPPNCMAWMGASIVSQLNSDIDKFELTYKEYTEKYKEEIPDRYGEAFFFAQRKTMDFNHEFEEYMRAQKSMIFSSTTPYSTKSYANKTPISSLLGRSINSMKFNDWLI